MTQLPLLSAKEIIRAMTRIGYRTIRQRGSHIRLSCEGKKSITVPNYKLVGRGLMRKILRDAELTSEKFFKLL